MKLPWKRGLLAIAFAATIIIADLGMGLDFQSIVPADTRTLMDDTVDTTERVWEGGGAHLAFADTMSGRLAAYFEEMDPLRDAPGENSFDYYGGAVAQAMPGEQPGRWGPQRWNEEWWRWGEESMQDLGGAEEDDPTFWHQEDGFLEDLFDMDILRFGEPCDAVFQCQYPNDAFSAVVSPVVDLRNVEPITRATHEEVDYRVDSPTGVFMIDSIGDFHGAREDVASTSRQTGIVEVGQGTTSIDVPAVHNASAALRLNHLYHFNAVGGNLEDGARVEISRHDPALGWRDWEPLAPSPVALRIGEDEFEGRYASPFRFQRAGLDEACGNSVGDLLFLSAFCEFIGIMESASQIILNDGSTIQVHIDDDGNVRVESGMLADDGSIGRIDDTEVRVDDPVNVTGAGDRPWLYQGEISASGMRDPRGSWSGFGGTSGIFVESVFDLSEHAGHLVRFRFVTATTGDGTNPNPGIGWLLEQMEVHALADDGVETIGPVTPTEGALLGHESRGTGHGDARPVVALQNFGRETKQAIVKIGLEGLGETTQRVSVPPGPWGRVFVSASESLNELGLMDQGLHHLNVQVMDVHDLDQPGLEARLPVLFDEKRFHFLRVGPEWPVNDSWQTVRVETELIPRHEEDLVNPADRRINRGQEIRIHVDLVNKGPEPVTLEFPDDPFEADSLLRPLLVNAQGESRGTFQLEGKNSIILPASREASGSLGEPDATRTVTWRWSGTPIAEVLKLFVEDFDGKTVLDGGVVRVETMQSSVLDVDFANRWEYENAEGCERRTSMSGRSGVLLCEDGGSIVSPASPVLSSFLRRGVQPTLSVTHSGGAATITLETAEPERSPSPGDRVPPSQLDWISHGSVTIGQNNNWSLEESELPAFKAQWSGWIRINITNQDDARTVVDEIRIDVGPPERRFPLLWHGFTGDLRPQAGVLRSSVDGGKLAILSGTAVGASDAIQGQSTGSCVVFNTPCELELDGDDLTLKWRTGFGYSATVATVAPDTSLLGLPARHDSEHIGYELNGSRPTLRFDHWMGPSVSAKGHVEVALLRPDLIRDLEAGLDVNLTWETVASFDPPRTVPQESLSTQEVALWEYAGEAVLIRFRYEYDAERQPGMAPNGWVLAAVSIEHTVTDGPQQIHRSTGDFEGDGYWGGNVDFNATFEGTRRAQPLVYDAEKLKGNLANRMKDFTARDRWMHFGRGDPWVPVCADLNQPSTYPVGRSVITDPVDLRAMATPLLALEHGGRFSRNSETPSPSDGFSIHTNPGLNAPGTTLFDLEWQVLGQNGQWGEWQRAVPFIPWAVWRGQGPEDWSGQRLEDRGLLGPGGHEVAAPFTYGTWQGNLVGEDASVFDLRGDGPAGEIARFRFLVWEEWWGHIGNGYTGFGFRPCDGEGGGEDGAYYDKQGIHHSFSFDWFLYSMRIFEGTHMLDAGVTGIRVSPDDRPFLDDLSPGLRDWRDNSEPEVVVSGDVRSGLITVEVDVENHGVLDHVANVTLELVDRNNRAVDVPIHFVDETGGIPRRIEDRNFGLLALAGRGDFRDAGESATATFRVEIGARGQIPPGEYSLRAFVDLDDGVDTNPDNDMQERALRVLPVRALDLDLSVTRVEPTVATPETTRTLTLELRNRGNVEETNVIVEASVVELVGFGQEAALVEGTDYRLLSRSEGLAPGTTARFTWDLVEDQDGDGLELASLLEPGTRYAVNVTIHPAQGSAKAWWDEETGESMQDALVDVIPPPGDRCGCYHVPFLAEALVAGSDLTPGGTFTVLTGYLDAAGSDPAGNWQTRTWFREDGRLQPADDRDDLPKWDLVDAAQADAASGRSGVQGAAWHLPVYDGYESLEHELRSPPIPGHIIRENSRGILDLRYASGLHDGQAAVEVRSLEPGGQWGPWRPVDDVRAHRVALVLPPDFPLVISDRLSEALHNETRYPSSPSEGHPVPPFYTDREPDSPVGAFVPNRNDSGLASNWEYNRDGYVSDQNNTYWSPYPLYHEPGAARNLESVEALATVLQMLAEHERVGADNVAVFTTFPHAGNEDHWEFDIPVESGTLGIRLDDSSQAPMFEVRGDDGPIHRVPLRDMDELGRRIDTYGALLLMGDGLTRWAGAQEERSNVLDRLSPLLQSEEIRDQVFENETGNLQVFQQSVGNPIPQELEAYIQEVLPALRLAPTEGIRLIGATGPASAKIGVSGVAEGVPLSVWTPPNTRNTPPLEPAPYIYRCLVDLEPTQNTTDPGDYWLNSADQPKQTCLFPGVITAGQGTRNNFMYPANYRYVAAPDAQAATLRELMTSGGARFALDSNAQCDDAPDLVLRRDHGDPAGRGLGDLPIPGGVSGYDCLVPQAVASFQNAAGVRFVTSPFAGNESLGERTVEDWVLEVLDRLEGQPRLGAGSGNWERLPISQGAPVGGSFRVDEEGKELFSGETFQFRIVIRSDPFHQESPGHGHFFLDSFQVFGTPEEGPKPEIRVANPRHGDVRAPLEEGFYVTVEVINKGLTPLDARNEATVTIAQIPDRGDCEGESKCLASAFNEPGQSRSFEVPPLGHGERHVATLGGGPLSPAPGAPDGIRFTSEATAFNNGRFPRPEDATFQNWNDAVDRMIFNVTAKLLDPQVQVVVDQDLVEVIGARLREPLLKDPTQDVIVRPTQANVGRDAEGIRGTDRLSLDLWLSNTGSFPNQDGTLSVEMYWATPFICYGGSSQDGRSDSYRRCDAEGNMLGHWQDQKWLVHEHEESVRIERGVGPVLRGVDIDLEENGIGPGVYQLDVTVATRGLAGDPSRTTRWVYIGDPDDPDGTRWATNDEDFMGINDNAIRQAWPPQQADVNGLDNPDIFVQTQDGRDFSCDLDSTVTTNTDPRDPDLGDLLRQGWAISGDDYTGPCGNLLVQEGGSTILQWVRDEQRAFDEEQRRWTQNSGTNVPDELGLGDFGPAHMVWHPEHGLSPQGAFNQAGVIPRDESIHSPAVSLANFAPGNATLVIDSRFMATEHTGYVVEMQVAQRQCGGFTIPPNQNRFGCIWAWNWTDDGSHWFPLQPVLPDGREPSDEDIDWFVSIGPRGRPPSQADCSDRSDGPPPCFRGFPTNPVAFRGTDRTSNQVTPGIWNLSSMDGMEGADENGWVSVRYPIDPQVQSGLLDYCDNVWMGSDTTARRFGNFFNQELEDNRRFFHCMYAASADGTAFGEDSRNIDHETPRPVAFRLSAGSYGGDEGQNYWHVRGITLTAHELALDGPDRFTVAMDDGDTRLVPMEIKNDGAVDDVVEIRLDMEPQPGIEVGLARSRHATDFTGSITERIPAGGTRTVWVNVTAEFGVFDRAGAFNLEEITVTAQSLMARLVDVRATIDVTLHQRERADLAIEGMIVNNLASDESGPIPASVGTPTHVSLRVQNEGRLRVDEPVLMRLLAQPIDATTGQPDCPGGASTCHVEVAHRIVEEPFVPRCRGDADCIVIVNFDWTPDKMGIYELTAEVNLPRPGHAIAQIPEARFGNNAESRFVKVGPVRLADLHVEDVRLVPFNPQTGCEGPDAAQERLIDGHTYCAQALLANRGNNVAMFPSIAFSVGAAEPWSFGTDFNVQSFESQTEQWITSSPLRAVRPPTAAGAMEFRVEADTQSPTQTVSGLERRLSIPVDDYDLDLRSSEFPVLVIEQGGLAELALEVRNSGTAVATPVARIGAEAESLRAELVQPPPLQPGESATLTLQVRAGASAPEGPRDVEISLTTAQDPLVDVPLPLGVTVVDEAPVNATVLPIDTVPGPATMEFVADNTRWATDSAWIPTRATGVISLRDPDGSPAFTVDRHDVRVHPLPVEIEPHTPPGAYGGTIRFEVSHGPLTLFVEAPYELKVLPDPGIDAHVVQDHVISVKGLDTNVTIQLENRGNQPVEIVLESQVDIGSVLHPDMELYLEPGERLSVDVHVRPGEVTRALGETRIQWRVSETNQWHEPEPLLWAVRQVPTGVRLESTTLNEVQPVTTQMQNVRVTLRNPGTVSVEAEALVVVNGLMHSRERTTLGPGSVSVVQLPLLLEEAGENTLQVVVRPAGSQVGLSDPVFHEVGGVDSRQLVIGPQDPTGEDTGDVNSLPLPGVGILLAALGAMLAILRCRATHPGHHTGAPDKRRGKENSRPRRQDGTKRFQDDPTTHLADGVTESECHSFLFSHHDSSLAPAPDPGRRRATSHPPASPSITRPDEPDGGSTK